MLSEQEVADIADRVLRDAFALRGYESVETTLQEDFDGVEIIRLRARFRAPLSDSRALLRANDDIRAKIVALGDRRFVFLSQTSPTQENDGGDDEDEDAPGIALQ